jgi:tetratricopeptide (TPR) repeat protein
MPSEKDEQQTLAVLINRAQALIDAGRWREAIEPLRQALAIAPEDSEVLCRASFASFKTGEFKQALAYAEQAVQSDPLNEWGHRQRGLVLMLLGRKADALASAEKAVRLAPQWTPAYYALVQIQIANQQLNEARKTALQAREIAPEAPESHSVLAMVAMESKSWDEAEKHLREALFLHPTSYAVLNDLGVCLFKQKRKREAIEMFRQAARANPAAKVSRNNLRISVVKDPVPGKILLVLILPQLIMSAIARGHFWLSIIAVLILLLTTCVILMVSLSQITSLRSRAFKQLPPDAQNFIRAEWRREIAYHGAGAVCGLSAVILLWWVTIRILIPPGHIFPHSATGWYVFAGLWACFIISGVILVRRGTSSHTSLWKWFLGLEANS